MYIMLSYLNALILGIVEGATEFLPISSTGHLILTSHLLKIPSTEFIKSFEIIIQLGAILAVVVLYFKKLIGDFELIKKLIVSFIPTGLVGLFLYPFIKGFLLGNPKIVLWALLFGGILLIYFEILNKKREKDNDGLDEVSYKDALWIGLFQSLAVIPGVSRSGATIMGGLLLKYKRQMIVEYSFMLAIPTMVATTGYELLKSGSSFTGNDLSFLAVGFLSAFFVALIAIKWLLNIVKKYTFIGFGVYRIAIAVLGFIILF